MLGPAENKNLSRKMDLSVVNGLNLMIQKSVRYNKRCNKESKGFYYKII